MKKLFVFFALLVGLVSLASCGYESPAMSYDEFMAAENGDDVIIEGYISARQSWWNGATLYLTGAKGEGYFVYNYECTEEEYNSDFVVGACLRVYGSKTIYAGEHEIMGENVDYDKSGIVKDAPKFDEKVLEVKSVKTEDLEAYQNALFTATLTVKGNYSFKDDANKSDDIYFTLVDANGNTMDCCVEYYLVSAYDSVRNVIVSGDFVDGASVTVTGYLYWWNGANPHITSIVVNK